MTGLIFYTLMRDELNCGMDIPTDIGILKTHTLLVTLPTNYHKKKEDRAE